MFIQNFGCEGVGHGDTVSAPGVGCLLMAPPSMTSGRHIPSTETFLFLDFDHMTSRDPGGRWNTQSTLNLRLTPIRNGRASTASCTSIFLVNPFLPAGVKPQRLVLRWGAERRGEILVGERQWFSLPVGSNDWREIVCGRYCRWRSISRWPRDPFQDRTNDGIASAGTCRCSLKYTRITRRLDRRCPDAAREMTRSSACVRCRRRASRNRRIAAPQASRRAADPSTDPVHPDDQQLSLRASLLQRAEIVHVQRVERSAGEHDSGAVRARLCDARRERPGRAALSIAPATLRRRSSWRACPVPPRRCRPCPQRCRRLHSRFSRLRPAALRRDGHRQDGRNGVARAGDVEHLMALDSGNVRPPNRTAIGLEKIHPARAARDEDALKPSVRISDSALRLMSASRAGPPWLGDCFGELLLVWRQQIGPAVLAKIAALRIDRHERLSPALDDGAKHLPGENALVVIRTHSPRSGLSRLLHGGRPDAARPGRQWSARLAIDAEHMLAASHHARFQRRRPVAGHGSRPCVSIRARLSVLSSQRPGSSFPTTPTSRTRHPSAARLSAAFAAPPGLSASRSHRSTWTGASGEMRSTSPHT